MLSEKYADIFGSIVGTLLKHGGRIELETVTEMRTKLDEIIDETKSINEIVKINSRLFAYAGDFFPPDLLEICGDISNYKKTTMSLVNQACSYRRIDFGNYTIELGYNDFTEPTYEPWYTIAFLNKITNAYYYAICSLYKTESDPYTFLDNVLSDMDLHEVVNKKGLFSFLLTFLCEKEEIEYIWNIFATQPNVA